MKTEVNPFLANGQENAFPPLCDIEWCIGRCPGLCTIFLNNFTWYLKFMLYRAVILIVGGTLDFVQFLCTNCALGALRIYQSLTIRKKHTHCFRIDYRVTLYLSMFSSRLIWKAVIAHCALQLPEPSGSFYSLTTQWIVNDHTINISQTVTAVYMSMIYRSLPDIDVVARFIMDLWLLHNTRSQWPGKRSLHQ